MVEGLRCWPGPGPVALAAMIVCSASTAGRADIVASICPLEFRNSAPTWRVKVYFKWFTFQSIRSEVNVQEHNSTYQFSVLSLIFLFCILARLRLALEWLVRPVLGLLPPDEDDDGDRSRPYSPYGPYTLGDALV